MTAVGCLVFMVVAVAFVALRTRRWLRQPPRPTDFLPSLPKAAPDLADVRQHRPVDEATLRQLDLGPDVERIVRLYHSGRLSLGVVVEHLSVERRRSAVSVLSEQHQRYGWYDGDGTFHERRTDDRTSGLLNHTFEPRNQLDPFLVAWDAFSNDHVVFYAKGGARREAPRVAPRPRAATGPVDPSTVATLLASVHEFFDDEASMAVLADRLVEIGDPRGTLMSLQLGRRPGADEAQESFALIFANARRWLPRGVDPLGSRFERGFPVEVSWSQAVDPEHEAWRTVKIITLSEPRGLRGVRSPFEGPLPRLSEVRNVSAEGLSSIAQRHAERLETLGVVARIDESPLVAIEQLARFPSLRRFVLEAPARPISPPAAIVQAVDAYRGPALDEVWLAEQDVHLPSLQARLRALERPLVVHFVFGRAPTRARERETAWIAVGASALTLHARQAEPTTLSRAQQALMNAGIRSPNVINEP